jgi:virginiamycin B lyase
MTDSKRYTIRIRRASGMPNLRTRIAVLAVASAVTTFSPLGVQSVSAESAGHVKGKACGHLYWTNGTWIGRADLSGREVDENLITRAAGIWSTGITVHSGHVFWGNVGGRSFNHIPKHGGTIETAELDGAEVNREFITGASLPAGVTAAGNYVYWANNLAGEISRARLNGTAVDRDFVTTAQKEGPDGVVVGSGHIYWANDYSIGRANLDGTGVNQKFIAVPNGPSGVSGLAVNSRHIYWTDETAGRIGRANLDGTAVDQRFIAGADFPEVGLVVASRYIYWANNDSHTIARAGLNGTQVNERFITVAKKNLFGLAVDPSCSQP